MDVAPRVGILGGTFDPVHYGHLAAAHEAASVLQLEQVLFLPASDPPHKQDEAITNAAGAAGSKHLIHC